MEMIRHDRVGIHGYSKAVCELEDAILDPLPAMLEVFTGRVVNAA
ncbi:MAG: hypothetical protein U5L08_15660 [Xanthomonadales bacterium]|nr:hypothetical protein [Xanthomonadales bacterium]